MPRIRGANFAGLAKAFARERKFQSRVRKQKSRGGGGRGGQSRDSHGRWN